MESLFRDIAQGAGLDDIPDLGKDVEDATDEERERAFKAAWEAMLVEGMNGTMNPEDLLGGLGATGVAKGKAGEASASGSKAGPSASAGAGAGTDFQENIRRAMDKLKDSDQKVRSRLFVSVGTGGPLVTRNLPVLRPVHLPNDLTLTLSLDLGGRGFCAEY